MRIDEMNKIPFRLVRDRKRGFTLVEVLISSAILGLTVSAVTIMIGNSKILQASSDHYRQAQIIAEEEMEDPNDHFLNYNSLKTMDHEPINLDNHESSQAPTVAYRDQTAPDDSADVFGDNVLVHYRRIQSTVSWTESGRTDSVTLFKRVTQVR